MDGTARRGGAARQRGGMLVEILVSLGIFSFGLLSFTSMQARGAAAEYEALQRHQALVLVDDMVSRINANRGRADDYVGAGLIGTGEPQDCSGTDGAARDLCEWANLIRGTAEVRSGVRIGSMSQARGCITRAADASSRYTVAIAWQGIAATGAPASACGQGDAAYPQERLRRVVSTTLCIAQLRDPAVAPALPRC
jgi:type IV pilus assembly protein PilV